MDLTETATVVSRSIVALGSLAVPTRFSSARTTVFCPSSERDSWWIHEVSSAVRHSRAPVDVPITCFVGVTRRPGCYDQGMRAEPRRFSRPHWPSLSRSRRTGQPVARQPRSALRRRRRQFVRARCRALRRLPTASISSGHWRPPETSCTADRERLPVHHLRSTSSSATRPTLTCSSSGGLRTIRRTRHCASSSHATTKYATRRIMRHELCSAHQLIGAIRWKGSL